MPQKPKKSQPSRLEILLQCVLAFAKGVGAQPISEDLIESLAHYLPLAAKRGKTWEEDRQSVLTNATELGRLCAELANKRGSTAAIGVRDFKKAHSELQKRWKNDVIILCRWHV